MSNPGVVTLASFASNHSKPLRIRIEDNIGESIHIHFNDIRFSLSIDEFLLLTAPTTRLVLPQQIQELTLKYGLDYHFLLQLAPFLSQLSGISLNNIPLHELRVLVRSRVFGKHLVFPRRIQYSKSYQALKSQDLSAYDRYPQANYPFQSNSDRLSSLYSLFSSTAPHDMPPLITINGQPYIRDGQHRASILASTQGLSCTVPVLNLQFSTKQPSFNLFRDTFFPFSIYVLRTQKRKLVSLPLTVLRAMISLCKS